MFQWIVDSRTGFVALLMATFIVGFVIYVLPALLAWSMGSPAACGHRSGGFAARLDRYRLDCRPDLGGHVREWREF